MIVRWVAHSCFLIKLQDGRQILFDPFESEIGYAMEEVSADFVCISHAHYDHDNAKAAKGAPVLLNCAGTWEFPNIKITGISTYHDAEQGKKRGENIAFLLEAEGVRLLHLGDLGHLPDADFYEKVGKVDLLMIPIGGTYTIDAKQAFEICKMMDPNLIIPMHYKTQNLKIALDPVNPFIEIAGEYFDWAKLGGDSFEITAGNKKKRSRIVVMEPSAG